MTAMDGGVKLDHMANQIATFFRSQPEAEAIAGVGDHIRSFWSPAMRRDLVLRVTQGAARLDPLVVAALPAITGPSRAASEGAAGPAERGSIGACDAG